MTGLEDGRQGALWNAAWSRNGSTAGGRVCPDSWRPRHVRWDDKFKRPYWDWRSSPYMMVCKENHPQTDLISALGLVLAWLMYGQMGGFTLFCLRLQTSCQFLKKLRHWGLCRIWSQSESWRTEGLMGPHCLVTSSYLSTTSGMSFWQFNFLLTTCSSHVSDYSHPVPRKIEK